MALDATSRVAQQLTYALLAAQFALVGALDAVSARVVTHLVVVIGLDVVPVHLADTAQYMRRLGAVVVAYRTVAYLYAAKLIQFLLQLGDIFFLELTHEYLLRPGGPAWILAGVVQVLDTLVKHLLVDAQ